MATKTVKKWTCDLCKKEGERYSDIAFTFCFYLTRREVCKECRKSFDAWFDSRKHHPAPAPGHKADEGER